MHHTTKLDISMNCLLCSNFILSETAHTKLTGDFWEIISVNNHWSLHPQIHHTHWMSFWLRLIEPISSFASEPPATALIKRSLSTKHVPSRSCFGTLRDIQWLKSLHLKWMHHRTHPDLPLFTNDLNRVQQCPTSRIAATMQRYKKHGEKSIISK